MQDTRPRDRGLAIWPAILIGIGVIWLLAEANILTSAHLSVLFRFWPILLVAVGLELLIGRRSSGLSMLVGVGAVVIMVGLVLLGPALGLAQSAESQHETVAIPLDQAESAHVQLDIAVGSLRINPLTDSDNLLEGDLEYFGTLDVSTSDQGGQRVVRLINKFEGSGGFFTFLNIFSDQNEANWDLGLNAGTPVDLVVNTGTGSADLRLTDIDLTSLGVHAGTGSTTVALPAMEEPYEALLTSGTGSVNVIVPENAAVTLHVNTGTGSATIDVPDGAAVQVSGSVGTGSINVPRDWARTQGEDDRFVGDEGVWQSPGFDTAERQIVITYDGGTGSLNIR